MQGQSTNVISSNIKGFQDKGWAWVVVFGAFLVHFLTAGCEKAFSLWYIEILDVFGTNSATAASLGGICAAVRLIMGELTYVLLLLAPIAVLLCDKYSIQNIVIIGGLLSCTGLLISSLTTSLLGLFIGFGFVYGSAKSIIHFI